jgi:hypothetical protein
MEQYRHWKLETVVVISEQFRDYWLSKTGKDATKINWQATWRNWCRSDITQRQYPPPGPLARASPGQRLSPDGLPLQANGQPSGADLAAAGLKILRAGRPSPPKHMGMVEEVR